MDTEELTKNFGFDMDMYTKEGAAVDVSAE